MPALERVKPELQEGRDAGEFVVSEGNGSISRETITVLSGETIEAAAVLGKVTASGKFKALDPAARGHRRYR